LEIYQLELRSVVEDTVFAKMGDGWEK